MAQVKGSYSRVIRVPGYHLEPKYDLHALRHLRSHGKHGPEFDLPLTSMIDMFSMLVIFLLMNFSSTGEIFFVPTKDLKIPNAAHGRQLETAPLISIFNNNMVKFDAESPSEGQITLVDTTEEYAQLRQRLQQLKALDEASHPGQPFKGQINIQADMNTQLEIVKKIMNVLVSEGWGGINFAVRPEGGSSSRVPAEAGAKE